MVLFEPVLTSLVGMSAHLATGHQPGFTGRPQRANCGRPATAPTFTIIKDS
jgi:hypothetical protein